MSAITEGGLATKIRKQRREKLRRRRKALDTKGMNIIMDNVELMTEEKYLENVIIIDAETGKEGPLNDFKSIKSQILRPDIMNLTEANVIVNKVIEKISASSSVQKIKRKGQHKWINCTGSCVRQLSEQIQREITSTAFFLRILTNSVIDTTEGECPLKFYYDNPKKEELTSVWSNDQKYFKLKRLDETSPFGRLIMGLGPSAAGKTFWAENVIKLIRKTDDLFPRSFLSIDGGLVRELSYIYQDIIEHLASHDEIDGLNNLVKSGFDPFHTNLFSAGDVKGAIKKYLKEQSNLYTKKMNIQMDQHGHKHVEVASPVSIYVPETLGNLFKDSDKQIKKYVEITGDKKWIGLYIWQSKNPSSEKKWVSEFKQKNSGNQDIQNSNIEGLSTKISGEGRELTEGKKYSGTAYQTSKKHGYFMLAKAPGAKIEIHNSGGKYIPVKGKIQAITEKKDKKLYSIIFDDGKLGEKRTNKDIYTEGMFLGTGNEKERKKYLNELKIGSDVLARKEFNKSVVIEYPLANKDQVEKKYILNKKIVEELNSIYLQKEISSLGQIGGRKTRRLRRKRKKRKTRKRRKKR